MYVLISNYEMYISACAGEIHSIYIFLILIVKSVIVVFLFYQFFFVFDYIVYIFNLFLFNKFTIIVLLKNVLLLLSNLESFKYYI